MIANSSLPSAIHIFCNMRYDIKPDHLLFNMRYQRLEFSLVALFLGAFLAFSNAQPTATFVDSIRQAYHIPEVGYAVVSSDKILEMSVMGVQRANTSLKAKLNDKFRIGSNTKAITGFIAAQLVNQHKISWNTRFFDLFPELKSKSRRAYHHLTLLDLLTFRTRLFPYTYTYPEPTQYQFTGNEEQQRMQFTTWFFQQKPVKSKNTVNFSNLGYVAAGQMLEKASGKSYKELVADLGNQLNIAFGFGNPNTIDSLQPWGHDQFLNPEPPGDNFKLNWLLPAGNINVSLPDYVKFIQLQLSGLKGQSNMLDQEAFNLLHYGLPTFSVGWFWLTDEDNQTFSYNIGNPGTFLSKVYVYKDLDKAFILFANAQSPDSNTGLDLIYDELKRRYME